MELNTKTKLNILFAAGGTGGHLFPAIAVAEQLQKLTDNNIDLEFIGTKDRIESKIIPEMGFNYHAIPITGYSGVSLQSVALPWRIFTSVLKSRAIMKIREVDALICAGAYISFPPGVAAHQLGVPYFIMESNVNLGKTNEKLAPNASLIFTSFAESENYIQKELRDKIRNYGNPIRNFLLNLPDKNEAIQSFELEPNKRTVLIVGGSLGARSINNAVERSLHELAKLDFQFIWQTGKNFIAPANLPPNVIQTQFIKDMASAYAASDLVVSRSGATAVAEICVAGKPSILVPMPSASNNEQYFNAKALEDAKAAVLVDDSKIGDEFLTVMTDLAKDNTKLNQLSQAVKILAKPDAAERVAKEILGTLNW